MNDNNDPANPPNDSMRCERCNQPMRHNVPRLGPDGGWVHADTGKLLCGGDPMNQSQAFMSNQYDDAYEKEFTAKLGRSIVCLGEWSAYSYAAWECARQILPENT